jgi:hypothetical protein
MNMLSEQQQAWQQSIGDLERREERISEWNSSYLSRLSHVKELESQVERKYAEQLGREKHIAELEVSLASRNREIESQNAKIQADLKKVQNYENGVMVKGNMLIELEKSLVCREAELEHNEMNVTTRQKELEQWESILRERERKIVLEQRELEEKEQLLHLTEDRVRIKEVALEKKMADFSEKSSNLAILTETTNTKLRDIDARERVVAQSLLKLKTQQLDLDKREAQLGKREVYLRENEAKHRGLQELEAELLERFAYHEKNVLHFYEVEWRELTNRHMKGINDIDAFISNLIEIVLKLNGVIQGYRSNITNNLIDTQILKSELSERMHDIEMMRDTVREIETQKAYLQKLHAEQDKYKTVTPRRGSTGRQQDGKDDGAIPSQATLLTSISDILSLASSSSQNYNKMYAFHYGDVPQMDNTDNMGNRRMLRRNSSGNPTAHTYPPFSSQQSRATSSLDVHSPSTVGVSKLLSSPMQNILPPPINTSPYVPEKDGNVNYSSSHISASLSHRNSSYDILK